MIAISFKINQRFYLTLALLLLCSINQMVFAQKEIKPFRDTVDNALDISNWLMRKEGFLPVPSLITEPALGFGGAASIMFFHSSYAENQAPPSVTGIAGGGTNNGTWSAGIFHAGFWKKDRIRYVGALFMNNVNIPFYGSGLIFPDGVDMNMTPLFLVQQIKFRYKDSPFFGGIRYMYTHTTNTFEVPINIPDFNGIEFTNTLSEVSALINYDTRNNVFTPTQGFFAEISASYSDEWLGGDALYGKIRGGFVGFMPLQKRFNLAVRYDTRHSTGDTPFWVRPFVDMRGVPLIKFQHKHVDVIETELTFNIYNRWYLKGFTGIGVAYENMQAFNEGKAVKNIGTGFRYELARLFGLHMGMDFAWSNNDFGFYIIAGHAWMR